jgi:hypothetical protein
VNLRFSCNYAPDEKTEPAAKDSASGPRNRRDCLRSNGLSVGTRIGWRPSRPVHLSPTRRGFGSCGVRFFTILTAARSRGFSGEIRPSTFLNSATSASMSFRQLFQ